jgi:hypothetical protein
LSVRQEHFADRPVPRIVLRLRRHEPNIDPMNLDTVSISS